MTGDRDQSDGDAREWLHGLLRQMARLAVDDAQRLKVHHEVAIHALRVRMKKLRALLRLAADKPKRGTVGEAAALAGAIKDGIAGLRDVQVMEKTAKKLEGDPLPIAPWVEAPAWSAAKTLRRCRELERALRELTLRGLTWEALMRRFARDARRARKRWRKCAKTHDGDVFHPWRKRLKAHYYQCLALEGAHDTPRRLKRLHELSRILGHEHDLTVLQGHLDDAAPAAQEAWERIESLRRALHEKAVKRGKKIW